MSIYHDEQLDGVRFTNTEWALSEGLDEYLLNVEESEDDETD